MIVVAVSAFWREGDAEFLARKQGHYLIFNKYCGLLHTKNLKK